MIKLEIKKNIFSFMFVISVFLLYIVFMLGDSGNVLLGDVSTTILGAIWNKYHGNWQTCIDSSCFLRMYSMWTDNSYLPVLAPVLCGLPALINYFGETETGNKKFMLSRCSQQQYYIAKIIGNIISAVMIVLIAVSLYYISLLFFLTGLRFTMKNLLTFILFFQGRWWKAAEKFPPL